METAKSFIHTKSAKIILWSIAIFLLVQALLSYTISEAVLNFLFAGIVPITGNVLAPDVVLMTVAVLVTLPTGLGVSVWLIRARRSHKALTGLHRRNIRADQPKPLKQNKTIRLAPSKPARRPVWRSVSIPSFRLLSFPGVTKWFGAVKLQIGVYADAAVRAVWQLSKILRRSISSVAAFAVQVVIFVLALAMFVYHGICSSSARFWAWLKPHALRFDTWLELQVRTVTRKGRNFVHKNESMRMVSLIMHETRDSVIHIFKHR